MKFKFYTISDIYIDYLFIHDMKVYKNYKEKDKFRPYFGPIFLNGVQYYIPLSSYKEKHKHFKDTSELSNRIIYESGFIAGLLNISNMIPVPNSQTQKIDFAMLDPLDAKKLSKQLRIIKSDMDTIFKKVEKCYSKIIVESPFHTKHCCKYLRLEKVCREFEEILKNR